MRKKGSTGPPIAPELCYIDRVSTEILGLICEELQLSQGEKQNLLAMCLVSRRMYLVTAPYLYRTLRIELTRASHIRLIKRLIHPGSQLAKKIQWLTISGTEKETDLRPEDIDILFSRPVRLREFAWNGSLEIPHHTLQTFRQLFPDAGLRIGALQTALRGSPGSALAPSHATLLHPGCRHLRAFHFVSSGNGTLYTGFKKDLVYMLHHNPQLYSLHLDTYLEIWDKYLREDPELLHELSEGPLPRVRSLVLSTSLFTNREIELCAQRGMFSKVLLLRVHHSEQLFSICARALDIGDLTFAPEHGLNFEGFTAQVEELADSKRPPFRNVQLLRYQTLEHMGSINQPWSLITQMPRLTSLELYYFLIRPNRGGSQLVATTTGDLERLRGLVPWLQKIVVLIPARPCRYQERHKILRELAMFERLTHITIYLFADNGHNCPAMLQHSICRQMFVDLLSEQKPTSLGRKSPTAMFKFVEPRMFKNSKWFRPDHHFSVAKSGAIESFRRQDKREHASLILDRLTNEELASSGRKQKIARVLSWDWRGYERERARRERNSSPVDGLGLSATLWDMWTC